ncbi:Autophagy protein 22 [Boothiomyces sp. JEL0838]|nr:Autophagy protein 22 [Boothiomyces sp. JEL0838]
MAAHSAYDINHNPCNTTASYKCSIDVFWFSVDTSSAVFFASSISVLIQFVLFVCLGSIADYGEYRKLFMMGFGYLSAAVGLGMLLIVDSTMFKTAILIYILGSVFHGASYVFFYSYVPILTRYHPKVIEKKNTAEYYKVMDKVGNDISSAGFMYAYFASVFELVVASIIVFVLGNGEDYGLPDVYPLQIGIAFACIWQIVVMIKYTEPNIKARPGPPLPPGENFIVYSIKNLQITLSKAKQLKELFTFLLGWFIFSDGISTVSTVAILYCQSELGVSEIGLLIAAILTPFAAGIGNFTWIKIQAKYKLTTQQTLVIQCIMHCLLPVWGLIGFFTPKGSFGLQAKWEIYVLACYYGFLLGASQSSCRVMFSDLLPHGQEAEFFSLYEITDRGSSWIGPLVVGAIGDAGDKRYSFVFLLFMLMIPVYVFSKVDTVKGKRDALQFASKEEEMIALRTTIQSEPQEEDLERLIGGDANPDFLESLDSLDIKGTKEQPATPPVTQKPFAPSQKPFVPFQPSTPPSISRSQSPNSPALGKPPTTTGFTPFRPPVPNQQAPPTKPVYPPVSQAGQNIPPPSVQQPVANQPPIQNFPPTQQNQQPPNLNQAPPIAGPPPQIKPPVEGYHQHKPPPKRTGFVPSFHQQAGPLPPPIEPQPVQEQNSQDGGWSWNSVWSTASKGLESAKAIAGTVTKDLASSETVKGIYQTVTPELQNLAQIATKGVTTLADTLAPPITPTGQSSKIPGTINIWMCVSVTDQELKNRLHIIANQSSHEIWLSKRPPYLGRQPVCDQVKVNLVDDSEPIVPNNLQNAISMAENTMERLQKLADAENDGFRQALLVVQPFQTVVESMISDAKTHLSYYCVLVCDAQQGLLTANAISQSVFENHANPEWFNEQCFRVLETAVVDILEEFMLNV